MARALQAGQGRCDPLTWEILHRDANLASAPFPDRLIRPPADGWGTPLRILRKQRTSTLTPLFALTGIPMVMAVAGFFGLFSQHLGRALTSMAGGVLTTGVIWALLWQVIRRGDRDQVTIEDDGRLHAVTRRHRFLTLGYRLDEGAVDLTRLTRAQVVPGSYTHENHRDQPQWWRLELEDDTGATAAINLMHPRTPRATLFPQLAWHLERSRVQLDQATRRAVELRLGRPLELVPAR